MLPTHFFAAPDFLELLRFWDSLRAGRPMPDWTGDLSVLPRELLPNVVVADRRGEPTYAYVGENVIRRLGSDATGKRIYAEVLRGAHARYLRSLGDDLVARRAPIFSAAVYEPDAASMLMTGRLYVPFAWQGSPDVNWVITLQLFSGSEDQLREVGRSVIVNEIRRDMIAVVPELCGRLDAVRRHYQISRYAQRRSSLAQDIDAVARELTGRALIRLPCFEEPDPVATA